MSVMYSEEEWLAIKKKRLKRRLKKKNKGHTLMFQFLRLRRIDDIRLKSIKESLKPSKEAKKSPKPNDKLTKIRNRLTGKKRASKERWNRFAGTSDAGSRGL